MDEFEFGAQMFAALANASRLHILEFLSKGPASVKEIAETLGLKQSMTSQHLAALYRSGVIIFKAEGNRRIYSLRGPRISQILKLVDEFYKVHISNLREIVGMQE